MKIYSREEVIKKSTKYFDGDSLAAKVFTKYALRNKKLEFVEDTPEAMHHRISKEFARIEKKYPNPLSEKEIFDLIDHFKYIIPQGSPMFGIGNKYQNVSLSNCFVIETVDSYGGICRTDERVAQISKRRGGVGIDISPIRPKGMPTRNSAFTTDGIVVFMERFSNTSREVAQCIAEGERVLTKRGLVAVENIKIREDAWTKEGWIEITDKFENGKKKIFELTTRSGYSIRTSKDHLFLNEQLEERSMGEFDIGDEIVLLCGTSDPYNNRNYIKLKNQKNYKNINNKPNNCIIPEILDEKLAYIVGYSYGDGYVELNEIGEPRSLSLACSNEWEGIKRKLRDYVSGTFNYKVHFNSGRGALERLRIHNKCILSFLENNRILKEKTGEIVFPSVFLNCPLKVIFSFLSGYFDADGSVTESKKAYRFNSINLQFLKQIQTVLMSIGIPSRITCEEREEENWHDIFCLSISGSYAKNKFIALMKESIKVQSFKYVQNRDSWLTPFKGKTFNIKRVIYSYCPDNSHYLSANTFYRLKEDGNKLPEMMLKDTIVSIKEVGVKNTYDLKLKEENLFWCEGFYVHNSGRRGAEMQTISVHHPEILNFIRAKRNLEKITGANVSVKVTDEFMNAVKKNKKYEQRWPVDSDDPKIVRKVDAREIWDEMIKAVYYSAEPGILFWDTIIRNSPSDSYGEEWKTIATNPCGELPLCDSSSCILMALNLSSYVDNPFTDKAVLNEKKLKEHVRIGQRLVDDLVDLELESVKKIISKIKNDPESKEVKENEISLWNGIYKKCKEGRRTGLGITGLGDCIAMSNVKYGSEESAKIVKKIYGILRNEAYRSSIELAKERGAFPIFDSKLEINNEFLNRLPSDIKRDIKKYGRRNISCLTTAPAGSVSVLAQTSSGFEPVFKAEYKRKVKINSNDKEKHDFIDEMGDKWKEHKVYHHGLQNFKKITGKKLEDSPYHGAQAEEIDHRMRVKMQSIATSYVDHAISSTVNLPKDIDIKIVNDLYMEAWESGCKGLTIYRADSRDGVLTDIDSTRECPDCEEGKNQLGELIDGQASKNKYLEGRPKTVECDIHRSRVGGGDWLFFVGMIDGQPYEIFGGNSKKFELPHKYKKGWIIKNGKDKDGITQYNLVLGSLDNKDEKLEFKKIAKHFNNYRYGAFTRLTSLAMRYHTPIRHICEQITKRGVEGNFWSFQRAMSRILKKYILEGEVSGLECPECHSTDMVYKGGCPTCMVCGHSSCA